jgi:hypothetical protein
MRTRLTCVIVLGFASAAVAAAKGFELRIVAVGDTFHGIRFKPASGESWRILNGAWEKLEEAAAPPAGDYDITIIPAEALLRKGKWNLVKEPPADPKAPAAKPAGPGFAMRHITVGDQLHVVRFHTKTGATWHLGGDTFEPLAEFGKVPAGEFDLTLIASKKDWMGFRIDRKAGTTWLLQANLWQQVAEPE